MKIFPALFALLLFTFSVQAGVPNLVGTWSGTYDLATPDGVRKSSTSLTVTRQQGNLLFATRTWKRMDGTFGHHQGKAASTASDKLIGVIGYDNKSVVFVKSGSGPECNGQFCGQIAGNTLKLILTQSGEVARAGQVVLQRQK